MAERSRNVRNQAAKGAKERKRRPRGEAVPKSVQQRAAAPQTRQACPGHAPCPDRTPSPPRTLGATRGAAGPFPRILKGLRSGKVEGRWVG